MESKARICELEVTSIVVASGGNPRQDMGNLFDLGDSMTQVGQLAPIIVNRVDGKNILVAGERRLRAAQEKGMVFVEAKVFEDLDVVTALRMTLAENKHKALDPIEEANGYQMLIDVGGYSVKQVAREFNMAPETVKRKLDLLQLPDSVKKRMQEGNYKLPVHQAHQIVQLKDESKMIEAAKAIAPSTGPVMNEAETKKYIEETFKPKEAKLVDEPTETPANKETPAESEKVETKKLLGENLKPIAAKIGISGKLFAVAGGVEILKATLTVAIDKDVKTVSLDRIFLGNNSDLVKMIKKHQPDKKAKKEAKAKTNKSEKN